MLRNLSKYFQIGKTFELGLYQNTITFKCLNNSSSHQFQSNRFYTSSNKESPCNTVLDSVDLKSLSKNLDLLITTKPEYQSLSNKIFQSKIHRKCLLEKDKSNLKRKLNFKLALIVLSFKRLTSAFECDFLDDTAKLELVKEIVINELKRNEEQDLDEKLDVLDLLGFDTTEADEDEELLFQLDLENNQKELDLDTFLNENGIKLPHGGTNSHGNLFIDYSEDIQQAVEREIEHKVSDLRIDFPDIDEYIQKLKLIVVSEWFSEYKDRYLESKCDQFDFGWENEDGDPEWICP